MSDERYELKGKIGQGGVGAVYRAFDNNLNREVAIKRVLPGGGYENDEEATKAMLHEATSLCSVQHPHIVTVFDAGVDSDGPYVVMELLSGRTLDEMVERGTLTYEDFREVALQSQEALIAAQDLDLVHRDIKPTNMMVTWLPSGRFQVKLVDFGLAKFSPQPSLQTIDHGDSVFGSIYFMAPEQFERTPLDQRTDMYSLGCVYYYCLTGQHPFDGETAPLVMTAHLQNRVHPLHELRPDLPKWLCDWVMWHIARDINDRPPNAREALKQFLMAETEGEVSSQVPVLAPGTNGTTPNIPAGPAGGNANALGGSTAPQPILPPEGQQPSVHTAAHKVRTGRAVTGPVVAQPATPGTGPVAAAAAPGTGTGPVGMLAGGTGPVVGGTGPVTGNLGATAGVALPNTNEKGGLSNTAKAVIGALIAVALGIAIVVYKGGADKVDNIERINEIVAPFADASNPPIEIELNDDDIELLLTYITTHKATKKGERQTVFQALKIGTTTDGSDLDKIVSEFAAEKTMSDEVRQNLFKVLQLRAQDSALPGLIAFASKTNNISSGKSALAAAKKLVTQENFSQILGIVRLSQEEAIQTAAADLVTGIVQNDPDKNPYLTPALSAYNSATTNSAREGLLRLLGSIGGSSAADVVTTALNGANQPMQIAALAALRNWPDTSMFEDPLMTFVDGQANDTLRTEGFKAIIDFLTNPKRAKSMDEGEKETFWTEVATLSVDQSEQLKVINAMEGQVSEWAESILDYFVEEGATDQVIDRAERAKRTLRSRIQRIKNKR